MILQSSMIAGKDEEDPDYYRTILGYYNISNWKKFYVDNNESYIAWDGRKIPKRGSSRKLWGYQGAFGVYTAILSPNYLQHLHGTIGWPNEKTKFIDHELNKKGELLRIGSKGCTRVDNQTIMFLRNFIPVGTPVIRIYAKEFQQNKNDLGFKKWTYVFYETKDLNLKDPLNYEHRKSIKESHLLEVGDFIYQSIPTIINESVYNPYKIKDQDLKGYFNINTGLVSKNYESPTALKSNNQEIPKIFRE